MFGKMGTTTLWRTWRPGERQREISSAWCCVLLFIALFGMTFTINCKIYWTCFKLPSSFFFPRNPSLRILFGTFGRAFSGFCAPGNNLCHCICSVLWWFKRDLPVNPLKVKPLAKDRKAQPMYWFSCFNRFTTMLEGCWLGGSADFCMFHVP